MSFPQTSADIAVQRGSEFWRLKTELLSSGDIYESTQSARAFVIGPESDVSKVKILYYDSQEPTLAQEAIVSVDKPFIGRLDALGSQTYQSGDQARLLISTLDILPPNFIGNQFLPPTALNVAETAIEIVPPQIDLLQYVNKEPSFIAPRADKTYQFGQLPLSGGRPEQWFLVPFYGRRFVDVCVKTLGVSPVGGTITPALYVDIYGINFSWILVDTVNDDNGHQQEHLGGFLLNEPSSTVTNTGVSDSIAIQSRSFDYLGVRIRTVDPNAQFPSESVVNTRIVVSDKL